MKIIEFFLILVVTFGTPICSFAESHRVKIGAILGLTGDFSPTGVTLQQGMELALAEGADKHFEIQYEDDRSLDRKAATSAVKKLIDIDKTPIILNWVVNTTTAISPILNSSKTLGIVIWDSNNKISSLGDFVFGFGYSTELAAERMAEYAFNKLKLRKLGVIAAQDEWSEIISTSFIEYFKAKGGAINLHESVAPDNTDFKSIISRANKLNLDGIYAPLFAGGLVSWINQSKQLGFKGALLTGDGLFANEVALAGHNAEGVYATQIWNPDIEFAQRFNHHFKLQEGSVNTAFAALGYDVIQCLVQHKLSLESKGLPLNSENFRLSLKSTPCSGIIGTTNFTHSRQSNKAESVVVVKNGELTLAE